MNTCTECNYWYSQFLDVRWSQTIHCLTQKQTKLVCNELWTYNQWRWSHSSGVISWRQLPPNINSIVKKVKFSHTRYRALGLELIPVYRQSAHRWLTISHPPSVACRYFPPGLRFTFVSIRQMAPPLTKVTDIQSQLTTHLSPPKWWKAELAWYCTMLLICSSSVLIITMCLNIHFISYCEKYTVTTATNHYLILQQPSLESTNGGGSLDHLVIPASSCLNHPGRLSY